MEVGTVSSRREQIEELLESFDVDFDFDLDQQLDQGGDLVGEASDLPDFVEVSSTSISTVEGFHPEQGSPDDLSREFFLKDGSRVSIQVKLRPECPSCGYIFNEEDDPVNPDFPSCTECGSMVCRNCRNVCEACGTPLCNSCTMGHGVKDETYCPICRTDVVEEVEHGRELEKSEQQHEQNLDKWEAKLEELKEKRRLLMEEDDQEHSQKMEEIQAKIDMARMINESESTEEIKQRLEASDSDLRQFPEFGNQFSGLKGADSDEESDDGYSYDEVFE